MYTQDTTCRACGNVYRFGGGRRRTCPVCVRGASKTWRGPYRKQRQHEAQKYQVVPARGICRICDEAPRVRDICHECQLDEEQVLKWMEDWKRQFPKPAPLLL